MTRAVHNGLRAVRHHVARSILLGALVACAGSVDQRPRLATGSASLPCCAETLRDGFTRPFSVVELSDGSTLVSDQPHSEVWRVDFVSGARQVFGRTGDGPGEFRYVVELFRLPHDSIGVFSFMVPSRLAILSRDGTPVRTIQLSASGDIRGAQADFAEYPMLSRSGPAGTLYGARSAIVSLGGGFSATLDSVPIMRMQVESGAIDTVAFFDRGESVGWRSPLPDDRAFVVGFGLFAAQNDWAVLSDGTLVTVDAQRFSLAFRRDGKVVRTVSVPVADSFPVQEEAWRKHVVASSESARNTPMYRGGIGRADSSGNDVVSGAPDIRVPERRRFWPPVLGYLRVRVASDLLWIPVSGAQSPDRQYWTVVDSTGTVLDNFELAPNTKLIEVTSKHVYTARTDDDDLHWVSRHPNPLAR